MNRRAVRNPEPGHRTRLLGAVAVLLALSAAACDDASSDPTAVLMAEETRAALHLAGELTSLPELIRQHEVRDRRTREAADRWVESWVMEGSEGVRSRNRAYALAAPALAGAMSEGALTAHLRDVDEAVAAAEALAAGRTLPEPVTTRLLGARRLADDAHGALERGERARALRLGLAAGDRLRSLSPRRVATRLLERAEEALRRNHGLDSYTPQELRRADRLIRGARAALEAGDFQRAVRRAFYACQVLGLNP